MLVKLSNGAVARYPYLERDLKADWPNTTFPADLAKADLADFDAAYVVPSEKPLVQWDQNLIDDVAIVAGAWTQVWRVVQASADEIAERTSNQWANVRSERNTLLAQSDWTQLPDAPVNAAIWASYRQALRDITSQPDPFNIAWPVPPA